MTINLIVALVKVLCPDLQAISNKYIIQNEKVTCMEYYTNDIINNPHNYKDLLNNVKYK